MIAEIAAAGALILAAAPAAASTADRSANPCLGYSSCVEYGSADVTGDGEIDRIGYRIVGPPQVQQFGKVTAEVVVTTADGHRYSYRSHYDGYFEGSYGTAPIDGVPGAEVALSWVVGAHTSRVEVLTFRSGLLIREKSWLRDAAATYGHGVEWIPGETAQTPIMRQCRYEDVPNGDRQNTRTFTTDFTWQIDHWVRGPVVTSDYANPGLVPWQCMRFRAPGMAPSPMAVP